MGRVIFLSALLLLSACTGVSPKVDTYVLSDTLIMKPDENAQKGMRVVVKALHFPEYLSRPHIVVRQGENQLQLSEFQRWGESLSSGFLRVFNANLGHYGLLAYKQGRLRKEPVDYQLQLEVAQFEVNTQNQAWLKLRWVLLNAKGKILLVQNEQLFVSVLAADFKAKVLAQSQLIAQLAQRIAEKIVEHNKSRSA